MMIKSEDDDDLTDEGNVQSPVCNPLLRKSQKQRNPVQILQVQPETRDPRIVLSFRSQTNV